MVSEMILDSNLTSSRPSQITISRAERKLRRQFGADLRPGDWLPDHERARCADVDGIEVLQLCGEGGRPEGPVTTDVDPSQQNDERHDVSLNHRRFASDGCQIHRQHDTRLGKLVDANDGARRPMRSHLFNVGPVHVLEVGHALKKHVDVQT